MSNQSYLTFIYFLAILLWANLGLAEAEKSSTCQKQPLETLCGLSDEVWDFVYVSRCEERPQFLQGRRPEQGETNRFFMLWEDQTWVLTMEFWDPRDSRNDVACIVAQGQGPSALEVPSIRVRQLPTKWIGLPPNTTAL